MNRKVYIFDENSNLIKKLSRNVKRLSLRIIILDFIFFIVVPLIIMFGIFGEYEVIDEINDNMLLLYLFAIILYFVFNFISATLSSVKLEEICESTFVKEDDTIFLIMCNWISYEIGLKNEPMSDEVIYRYSRKKYDKLLKPTIEEVNAVLDRRPKGFYITEYKNCKLVKKKRDFYEFVGVEGDNSSKFRVYKAYLNINSIVEGEI